MSNSQDIIVDDVLPSAPPQADTDSSSPKTPPRHTPLDDPPSPRRKRRARRQISSDSEEVQLPTRRVTIDVDRTGEDAERLDEADVALPDTPPRTPLPRQNSSYSSSDFKDPQRKRKALKDTPICRKENGQKGAFLPNKTEDVNRRYAAEAQRVVLGPMPVKEFLDEFLPSKKGKKMPAVRGAFDKIPQDVKHEQKIYAPLIEAINNHGRCPSVKFFDSSAKGESSGRGSLKPDITGYTLEDANSDSFIDDIRNGRATANLGLAELFFEVKASDDPFCDEHEHDDEQSFLAYMNHDPGDSRNAYKEKLVFGQNVTYAAEACARQHRAFYFSVLIVGTCARLFRWDRAGVVVTELFDYQETPKLFCEFLWRFHLASPVERGFDPTVTIASPEEEGLFKDIISEEVAFQKNIDPKDTDQFDKELGRHYEEGKVTKMLVFSENGSPPEEYLVSVPVASPTSADGRCTRAYWAVRLINPKEGVVAFVKDTWRVDALAEKVEGCIYGDIHKKVKNIPTAHTYGDVLLEADEDINVESKKAPAQTTRTDDFRDAPWVCSCLRTNYFSGKDDLYLRVVKHTHSRLVLDEVGYPLSDFADSRELFEATRDAFEALDTAYTNCDRLHRDVSINNIILVRSRETKCRRGMLIDWEFSVKSDRYGRARDYIRSGTWPFMSAASLSGDDDFRHSTMDDLESLFYVTMKCCLLWLPHNVRKDLGNWMHDFFDESIVAGGKDIGGLRKYQYLAKASKFTADFQFDNEHIQRWFREMYILLNSYSLEQARLMNRTDTGTGKTNSVELNATNVRKQLDAVCKGLASTDERVADRMVHKVSDYHKEIPVVLKATYSCLASGAEGSAASGSKRRPNAAADGDQPVGDGKSNKRTRFDVPSGKSNVLNDGSNKANRSSSTSRTRKVSRASSKSSLSGSIGRRSARLAKKNSKSSLTRA